MKKLTILLLIVSSICVFLSQTFADSMPGKGISNPADLFTQLHHANLSAEFEITFLDEKDNIYDHQQGIIHWYSSGDTQIENIKPLDNIITATNDLISNYQSFSQQVSISPIADVTIKNVFDFLVLPAKFYDEQFYLESQKSKSKLIFKDNNKSKMLASSIHIYLSDRSLPTKLIFKDNLNYKAIVNFKHFIKMKAHTLKPVTYSKSVEVINHVRHSVV